MNHTIESPNEQQTTREFGKNLRRDQFGHHNAALTRLNNGSFGACPDEVLKHQSSLRSKWLENPDDDWYAIRAGFDSASLAVAKELLGDESAAENVFLVDNLTVAFALIADSVISTIRDRNAFVITSNKTYNAVSKAARHCVNVASTRMSEEEDRVSTAVVDIPFPILDGPRSEDIILDAYKTCLDEVVRNGGKPVVAVIDHISSLPSMLMPVHKITAMLRSYGVKEIVVDGAHTPGQLDIQQLLPSLDCDIYMANLHKWAFSPTSAAFLWISPACRARNSFHHPIISHDFDKGLQAECSMLGTRDYSAMLSVSAGIDFLNSLGGIEKVSKRNKDMCFRAMQMLSEAWGVSSFCHPQELCASMGMVGCPQVLGDSEEDAERIRLALRERNIVVQRLVPVQGDRLYLRVSCGVYNDWTDFEVLRDAMLEIMSSVEK